MLTSFLLSLLLSGARVNSIHQPPPQPTHTVRGEIIRLYRERNELILSEYTGKDWAFAIPRDVKITVDNKAATLDRLAEFMQVTISYDPAVPLPIAREIKVIQTVFYKQLAKRPADNENIAATMKVFYGTDRERQHPIPPWAANAHRFALPTAILVVTALLMLIARLRKRRILNWLTLIGWMATAVLVYRAIELSITETGGTLPLEELYGNERHLTGNYYGTCTVSIPREHKLGKVESPSILRLEFHFDPAKHVMLQGIEHLPEDAFVAELRADLERCVRKEALVFIHGYNVSFADAARRTAQLAYDLEFDGPALFFSWPSQGGLLQYTVDENNADWSTPDVANFLHLIATRAGIRCMHVVAHSMGNRALAGAFGELAHKGDHHPERFRDVVLAAPDIDAGDFERRYFPTMQKLARRFTLYASSNDNALAASKKVHGLPRAGDSGIAALVLLPVLYTIDVSKVDTSFLGHSYYGDSKSIITDLHHLIDRGEPPQKRPWLSSAMRESLKYWIFKGLPAVEADDDW